MYLAPNMYKIITLNANAKKIVSLKCVWHHICTKTVTLKANAQENITLKPRHVTPQNDHLEEMNPVMRVFNTHLWGF